MTESAVAKEITRLINSTSKTQYQITEEMGLPKSNILTMFKQGRTKLPIKHVPALCRACDGDPARLLRMALEEYHPEMLAVIEDVVGHIGPTQSVKPAAEPDPCQRSWETNRVERTIHG